MQRPSLTPPTKTQPVAVLPLKLPILISVMLLGPKTVGEPLIGVLARSAVFGIGSGNENCGVVCQSRPGEPLETKCRLVELVSSVGKSR